MLAVDVWWNTGGKENMYKKKDSWQYICYSNYTFHEFKVLKKVIIPEMFNIDFHNKFFQFGLFCLFYFSSYYWI